MTPSARSMAAMQEASRCRVAVVADDNLRMDSVMHLVRNWIANAAIG